MNTRILTIISMGTLSLLLLYVFYEDSFLYFQSMSSQQKKKQKEKVLIYAGTTYFGTDVKNVKNNFLNVCPKEIRVSCFLFWQV